MPGMDVVSLLTGLLIGALLGAVIGFLMARTRAAVRVAEADARAHSATEKLVYVEGQLTERFQALSTRALDVNNIRFLELAETRLAASRAEATGDLDQRKQAVEHLVEPLKDALGRVEAQLRDTESGQRAARAELAQQMDFVRQSHEQLRAQTTALVRALQRPEARGR